MGTRNIFYLLVICIFISQCGQKQVKTSPYLPKWKPHPEEGSTDPKSTQAEDSTEKPYQENPKIGLILGPGGLKTFAHIGVLREFEKLNLPIHSITGLEWGALVAALYSVKGKAHDVEWKLLKLKSSDIPGKGLFAKVTPQSLTLNSYLSHTFQTKPISKSELPFICPAYSMERQIIKWIQHGSYQEAVSKCIPYPPLFKPHEGYLATPFDIQNAAMELKKLGADIVVYVDLLQTPPQFNESVFENPLVSNLLWQEGLKRSAVNMGIDWVIQVNSTHGFLDFSNRKSAINEGKTQSQTKIQEFAEKYGF
jgi:NTE family protein